MSAAFSLIGQHVRQMFTFLRRSDWWWTHTPSPAPVWKISKMRWRYGRLAVKAMVCGYPCSLATSSARRQVSQADCVRVICHLAAQMHCFTSVYESQLTYTACDTRFSKKPIDTEVFVIIVIPAMRTLKAFLTLWQSQTLKKLSLLYDSVEASNCLNSSGVTSTVSLLSHVRNGMWW